MSNGNGKATSADALFPHEIDEDEEDFDYVGEAARFDGNEELLPTGYSAAAARPESAAEEPDANRDLSPPGPAPGAAGTPEVHHGIANPKASSTNAAKARDTEASDSQTESSTPQTADSVKTAQGAKRPQRRRRWLAGAVVAAILAGAGSLAWWLWPFGNLESALASVVALKSEIAAASPEAPAPQSLPADSPIEIMGAPPNAAGAQPNAAGASPNAVGAQPNAVGAQSNAVGAQPNAVGAQPNAVGAQPNAAGANLQAYQQFGTRGGIGALPVDGSHQLDAATVQAPAGIQQDAVALALAVERLEGIESLLTGLHERLDFLEENQRQLEEADSTGSDSPEPQIVTETSVDVVSEKPPGLHGERDPVRADIGKCGAEGRSVIESLGRMQMAAHEGADGRRWIRVLGPHWRRDVSSGDRLPLGSPGEARLWVDGAGVFGVVDLPGREPCRMDWD